MDMCKPFRPRSGACQGCFHLRPSGEASQPGLRAPAGTLAPDPARTLLRLVVSGPLPQGRHREFWSTIVGLAPRVLPLTPQVAFIISIGRPRFRCLPLLGSYHVSVVTAGFPASSSRIAQSATARIPFHPPVATPEGCSGFDSDCPEPLDGGPPHWLTVATAGFHRTVFTPCSETPERGA
jgi:hypothetical protein